MDQYALSAETWRIGWLREWCAQSERDLLLCPSQVVRVHQWIPASEARPRKCGTTRFALPGSVGWIENGIPPARLDNCGSFRPDFWVTPIRMSPNHRWYMTALYIFRKWRILQPVFDESVWSSKKIRVTGKWFIERGELLPGFHLPKMDVSGPIFPDANKANTGVRWAHITTRNETT